MTTKKKKVFLSFCLVLSLYIFGVAMYIEFLNHQAGVILPRKEYRNNDPKQGLLEWRYYLSTNLKGLGTASSVYSNDSERTTVSSEPNISISSQPAIENQLERDVQAQRIIRLHHAVIKFGLPQYPLLFLSFVCMFVALAIDPKRNWYFFGTYFLLNMLSLIALIGRDYFGSLGW